MPSHAVDVHTEPDDDVEDLVRCEELAHCEDLARCIVRAVRDYTGGLPGRWVPLMTIVERLALQDEGATTAAVELAVDQRWLDEFGGHSSIRLTHIGHSIR